MHAKRATVLADIVSAGRLLPTVVPMQILALVLFATSGSAVAAAASLLIGVFGIAPHALQPYASLPVPASRFGRVTGMLTRGIVIGILLAPTASG